MAKNTSSKPASAKSSKSTATAAQIHDQKMARGNGGELHQVAEGELSVLTTAQGGPVADDQNSLRV